MRKGCLKKQKTQWYLPATLQQIHVKAPLCNLLFKILNGFGIHKCALKFSVKIFV